LPKDVLSVVAVRYMKGVVVVRYMERVLVVQGLTSSEGKSVFRNETRSKTSANTDDYMVYIFLCQGPIDNSADHQMLFVGCTRVSNENLKYILSRNLLTYLLTYLLHGAESFLRS